MDTLTLCGWSAYHMLRVPPAALWLAMLACADILRSPSAYPYRKAEVLLAQLGAQGPLEVCVPRDASRPNSPRARGLVRTLPPQTIPSACVNHRVPGDVRAYAGLDRLPFRVTSPEMTLLTLAPALGPERLALAASELMGSFCVFEPPPRLQLALARACGREAALADVAIGARPAVGAEPGAGMRPAFGTRPVSDTRSAPGMRPSSEPGLSAAWGAAAATHAAEARGAGPCDRSTWECAHLPPSIRREARRGGWRQVPDPNGVPTNLWRRSPLLNPARLDLLLRQTAGCHGSGILRQAARLAVPHAASPFEVQAALLLGLPRRLGGEGLGGPACNRKVALSPGARLIARQSTCYCDLYFSGDGPGRDLAVECHSHIWHDYSERKRISDASRAAGLASMGIDVLLLTHATMGDDRAFAEFARLAREKLGLRRCEKSQELEERRQRLRSALLGVRSWKTFGP